MGGGPIRPSRRRRTKTPPQGIYHATTSIYGPYVANPPPAIVYRPQVPNPPATVYRPQVPNPPAIVYRPQALDPFPAGVHRPQAPNPYQDDEITDEEINWMYDLTLIQLNMNTMQIGEGHRPNVPNPPQVTNSLPTQEVPSWAEGYETDPGAEYVPHLDEDMAFEPEHNDLFG